MTDDDRRKQVHEAWERAQAVRESQRTEEYLRAQLNIRNHMAHFGWFEYIEPENGGTAIAHVSDLETYIVGHIMNDSVVLDPGEDFVRLSPWDFPSIFAFMEEFKLQFNQLVKEWYGE